MQISSKKAAVLLGLGLVLLTGCSTGAYLWQAAKGQLAVSNRARPIDQVIQSERTPREIKSLLSQVQPIKAFGEKNGLKPTSNYRSYVQWDDVAISWVVSASRPLKFEPKTWDFPIVGSFNYLGWFSKDDAKDLAQELEKEGWDVYLRGASAYSTLGWFEDPILSTMISNDHLALAHLVNVILHESVHATFYISSQSYFNESLASFVADRLTVQYLDHAVEDSKKIIKDYHQFLERREKHRKKLHQVYQDLDAVYRSERPDQEKSQIKDKTLATLAKDLGFKKEINNAFLIQYKTYGTGAKGFEALYRECGQNWNRFWKVIRQLTAETFQQDQQEHFEPLLQQLRSETCSPSV